MGGQTSKSKTPAPSVLDLQAKILQELSALRHETQNNKGSRPRMHKLKKALNAKLDASEAVLKGSIDDLKKNFEAVDRSVCELKGQSNTLLYINSVSAVSSAVAAGVSVASAAITQKWLQPK